MKYYTFKSQLILLTIIFNINLTFAGNNEIVENIISYIENMKSIAISFEQSDSEGAEAKGVLIIDKPHKFRVNYFLPYPLLIVGNKNYVSVYDYEMENLSRISAKENLFNFLLVDKINFENQFKIVYAKEVKGYYILKLSHVDSGRSSEIKLNKITHHIEQMKIFEDNKIITLKFGPTQILSKIQEKLFILQDPDIFGQPTYLDERKLKKYYE